MMTKKPFPALCMKCKHSMSDQPTIYNNKCYHPLLIAADAEALARSDESRLYGVNRFIERGNRSPFARCGMRGKLWEPIAERQE